MFKRYSFVAALALGAFVVIGAAAQSGTQPQQHQHEHSMTQDMDMHDMHHQEVNQRGDVAMGFSHMKTTHHFRLSPSGGSNRSPGQRSQRHG